MSISVRSRSGKGIAHQRFVQKRGQFEHLESRLCLAVFYDFDVVAATGSGGIVDIEPAASVNDHGAVAFVASRSGGQSIYFAADGGSPVVVSFAASSTSRTYGRELEINNANQIAAIDRVSGGTVGTLARLWNANSPQTFTTLARGTSPSPLPGHFDILSTSTSLSNDGKIAIAGLDSSAATWELHQSDNLIEVNDVFSEITSLPSGSFFRLLGADGDRSVVASRQGADTQIVLRDITGFDTFRTVASTTSGLWSELGVRVGLSNDGAMVAFYGNLTAAGGAALHLSPGPGIFVSIDHDNNLLTSQKLVRVAGVAGNGVLDDNESFDDVNENGAFDAGDVERGVASFDADSRVAIARSTNPEAEGAVFHVAWTSTDSVDSTKAIFASNLKMKFSGSALAGVDKINAGRVMGVGQSLAGLGVLTDVAIHDALNGAGQIAFWATTGGSDAIVLADPRPPKVVVVSTHGFGNVWNSPIGQFEIFSGFLNSWYSLGNKFEDLPNATSDIYGEVASYVSNWNSSDGWIDALLSLTGSIVLTAQGNLSGASKALAIAEAQMARAEQLAEQAAAKIFSDLKASGILGDATLSQSGEQIIQLVGHSRGAAVNAQLAKLLADQNYEIEEYIALDGYSTDWPGISSTLGDISIVDTIGAVKLQGRLNSATNYRVQEGLADHFFDAFAAAVQAVAATQGFVTQLLTAGVLAAIKNALPDWRAPDRNGFNSNEIVVGSATQSDHLDVVDLYLGKEPAAKQYILESYVGKHRGGTPVSSTSLPAGEWNAIAQALLAPVGFADGDFTRSDDLRQSIADLNLGGNAEPFLQMWGALQTDSAYALGSYWQTAGPVELIDVQGNPAVKFSEAEIATLSQRIYVPSNAVSIDFQVNAGGAEPGDELRAYFGGAEIGAISLDQVPGGGAITLLLPASALGREGDFSLELVGHGSLAASVIVDDLEVVINTPQFGADFNTDSIVDGQDFLLWQRGFGKPVPTASKIDGDADGDQDVDSADLSFWQQQYGGLTVNAVALASAQLAAVGDAAADIDQPSQNQFIDLALTALLASDEKELPFLSALKQISSRFSKGAYDFTIAHASFLSTAGSTATRNARRSGSNETVLRSGDSDASRCEWSAEFDLAFELDLRTMC